MPLPLLAETLMRAEGSGKLVIAVDGSVSEVALDERLGKRVDEALRQKMLDWKFEPIVEQGQAVEAVAHMSFSVSAVVDADDGAEVKLDRVSFVDPPGTGEPGPISTYPPQYPNALLRQRLGASVELMVEIGADGKPLRAAFAKGELFLPSDRKQREGAAQRAMQRFAEVTRQAVMKWTLEPSADGTKRMALVPVRVTLSSDPALKPAPWNIVQPVQLEREPWVCQQDSKEVLALSDSGLPPPPNIKLLTPIDATGPTC